VSCSVLFCSLAVLDPRVGRTMDEQMSAMVIFFCGAGGRCPEGGCPAVTDTLAILIV